MLPSVHHGADSRNARHVNTDFPNGRQDLRADSKIGEATCKLGHLRQCPVGGPRKCDIAVRGVSESRHARRVAGWAGLENLGVEQEAAPGNALHRSIQLGPWRRKFVHQIANFPVYCLFRSSTAALFRFRRFHSCLTRLQVVSTLEEVRDESTNGLRALDCGGVTMISKWSTRKYSKG